METSQIIFFSFFAIFILYQIIIFSKRDKTFDDLLLRISRILKIEFKQGQRYYGSRATGYIDGVYIHLVKLKLDNEKYLKITSSHTPNITGNFEISKETASSYLKKTVGIQDILTKDKKFDDRMLISAAYPFQIISILGKETRQRLLSLSNNSYSIEINRTSIIVLIPVSKRNTAEKIAPFVKMVSLVSTEFSKNKSVKKRLLENIETEKFSDVKINNIDTLTINFPFDEEILNTLRNALDDRSVSVQITAAQYLGDEGMEHLVDILETNKTRKGKEILNIISVLRKNKYIKSRTALKNIYKTSKNEKILIEILRAFKDFGYNGISSFLLEQLDRANGDVRDHLIEALGACGKVEAVEKLYTIGKDSMNPFIRNAVNKAIGQIQSRLGTAESGWLSVAELSDKDGALSISENASDGSLSIVSKKKLK